MKYAITIVITGLILSIALGLILVFPAHQKFQETKESLQRASGELQSHRDYQSKLETIKNELDRKEELVAKVISALPDEADIPSFLNFLDSAAGSSGVSIESISWQETDAPRQKTEAGVPKERTKSYTVNLNFSASYFAFKNFLYTLESSARLIEVSRVDFQTSDLPEEPITFTTVLIIHSY
jgi:Tfp pilus assembly protein PilO